MKKLFSGWRHPVRIAAMALAALSLAWGVALTEALVAAMLGAMLGVIGGELAGRSRLRLPVAVGGFAFALLACWEVAATGTSSPFLSEVVGPGNALVAASVLRFGSLAFCLTGGMRAVAVRHRPALALELAFITAAFTAVFASHREGVIARPLWLSDWAWQQGIDPAHVLLGIGGVSVMLLAVLLIAETRAGRALSSLLVLATLSLSAVLLINVVGAPTPQPMSELNLDDAGPGQPPRPTPDGGPGHGHESGDGGTGNQRPGQDGGAGPGGDAGLDGGGSSGGDAGDGGGGASTGDGGDGGGSSAGDGGGDGGSSGSSANDGGDGGGSSGADGGDGSSGSGDGGDDVPMPHLIDLDGSTGQGQDASTPQRPPPVEQLDQSQSPSNSPAPMAVVVLDDDYSPPSGAYYFRQEVWSQYNGTRLIATTRNDIDHDVTSEFPTLDSRIEDVPPVSGRTRVSALVALIVPHAHPFALESPMLYQPAPNPNPERFVRAYRFQSLAQTLDYRRLIGRPSGQHAWSPEVRAYYTQAPTDPRYHALAQRIVNERLPARLRNDPFAQALAIKLWLDHNLIYSTRARHAGVADPTSDFLFGDKTGYCVHFAHSAVFLWRSLGIPARISAGYHFDESNRRGGSTILLRGGDAHAWPEVAMDNMGWIVLDIAAERNIDPPGSAPDEDLQRILGEMARQQPPQPNQPPPPPNQRRPQSHDARNAGYALLTAVLAALAGLYLAKLWRRVVPAFAGPRHLPRVGYRKALDLLAEAGMSREYGESRERFAARVAERVPAFVNVTEMHLSARLGDPARAGGASSAAWSAALRALRTELPKAAPWWRRALGLINPTSLFDAR